MSLEKLLAEDRRLLILRLLERSPDYTLNVPVLQTALISIGGVGCSRDRVAAECAWLAEQGLVTTRQAYDTTLVRLTERGIDTALGHARVPGVKRPGPGGPSLDGVV